MKRWLNEWGPITFGLVGASAILSCVFFFGWPLNAGPKNNSRG